MDTDNEDNVSPVLAPKRKEVPKEDSMETTPVKAAAVVAGRTTPASSVAPKGKRKAGADESKSGLTASSKKVKAETTQEVRDHTPSEGKHQSFRVCLFID